MSKAASDDGGGPRPGAAPLLCRANKRGTAFLIPLFGLSEEKPPFQKLITQKTGRFVCMEFRTEETALFPGLPCAGNRERMSKQIAGIHQTADLRR